MTSIRPRSLVNQAIIITDLYGTGSFVNSVDPGWLATDGYRYGLVVAVEDAL